MNIVATEQHVQEKFNKIPNLYVWRRYTGNPKAYTETEQSNVNVGLVVSGTAQIYYSETINVTDGAIVNEGFELLTSSEISAFDVIKGKYVRQGITTYTYYYIPADATFTKGEENITVDTAYTLTASTTTAGTFVDYVSSEENNTYPTSGTHTDNYWYEYSKQLGEGTTNTSGSGNSNITQVQTDYAQNDETAVDYIKNRPFYDNSEVMFNDDVTTVLYIDNDTGLTDIMYRHNTTAFSEVAVGDKFDIEYNDTLYSLTVCEAELIHLYVGNVNIFGDNFVTNLCEIEGSTREQFLNSNPQYASLLNDTGEDFLIVFSANALDFITKEEGTYHFTISKVTDRKQIDEKYIPDTIARISDIPDSNSKSIIDVLALPETDIQEDTWYRLHEPKVIYDGLTRNDKVYAVNSLPETGTALVDENDNFTLYYNLQDQIVYGYADEALATQFSLTAGWYNFEQVLTLIDEPYGGVVTSIADCTGADTFYVLVERYVLYTYKNEWKTVNHIGISGTGLNSEIFNYPSNVASGISSHAEGYQTTASGDISHAEGAQSTASGEASHAEGFKSTASGSGAHAEGVQTEATGNGAHAEGFKSKATEQDAHAEGNNTTASAMDSHAEGGETVASGVRAHAEGYQTEASGYNSHSEGFNTKATFNNTHAEGAGTISSGLGSHSEGIYTKATGKASHVQGTYNVVDEVTSGEEKGKYAHIIGNGESDNTRSNAHTVDWDGNAWYAGNVYVDSTSGKNRDEGSKKLATEEFVNNAVNNVNNGSSSTGSAAIIDIGELPTNNDSINENAFYRLVTATFVYNQYRQDQWTCHCVKILPTTGDAAFTGDLSNSSSVVVTAYYNISDETTSVYLTDDLATQIGKTTGWYPIGEIMTLSGYTFNGYITDILDDPKDSTFRLLLEYEICTYKGEWKSLNPNSQADYAQSDSTANDYIKNRLVYKDTVNIYDQDVTTAADDSGLISFDSNTSIGGLNMNNVSTDDIFEVKFNGVSYICEAKMLWTMIPSIGNRYLYYIQIAGSEEEIQNGIAEGEIPPEEAIDTGEDFLINFGADTVFITREAGTNHFKVDKVTEIKKLSSSMIEWTDGGAPSSLPEVTEDDNDKVLMVVGGKWVAASIANGDEVAY